MGTLHTGIRRISEYEKINKLDWKMEVKGNQAEYILYS